MYSDYPFLLLSLLDDQQVVIPIADIVHITGKPSGSVILLRSGISIPVRDAIATIETAISDKRQAWLDAISGV